MLAVFKIFKNKSFSGSSIVYETPDVKTCLRIADKFTNEMEKVFSPDIVENYPVYFLDKIGVNDKIVYSLVDTDYFPIIDILEVYAYPTFFKALFGGYGKLSVKDKFIIFKERFKSFFFFTKE